MPKFDFDNDEYHFGRCFVDLNYQLSYVPIEKNVSRIIQSMVTPLGFKESNFLSSGKTSVNSLVVLRDPALRWISGMVEYLLNVHLSQADKRNNMARHNITVEKALEQIVFDKHTCQQYRFLKGLTGNTQYIWFDQDQPSQLTVSLSKYFNQQGFLNEWTPSNNWYNADLFSQQKKELTHLYQGILKQHPDMLQRIKNFYSKDYELINSLKFYS
jgi:hypothetical protein